MPEPYNYLTNLPNPGQQMLAGLQSGMGMAQSAQQMRLAQEQADQMAMLRGAQMEQEQAQTAKIKYEMGLSQDRERAVADYFKRPAHERTVEAMEPILAMMPKDRADAMRAANEAKTKEQRMADVKSGVQTLSAVMSGDREAYERIIGSQMAAAENAGDFTRAQALASALKLSPEAIELTIKANLASLGAEGKQALDNLSEVQKAQFEKELQTPKLAKAVAEGKTAEIVADTERKMREAEIALKGAQTTSAKASAGASYASAKKTLREIDRINALEPGEVRKLAAEADKLEAEAREKRGEMSAQGAVDAGQRVLDTVALLRGDRVDAQGRVARGDYGVIKQIAGPVKGRTPTVTSESSDAENAIETLKNQAFISQIKQMKGMGALSEKEGDRLAASIANLSLTQSPERLRRNIEYIEETMRVGMERAQKMAPAQPTAPKAGPVALPSGFKYTVEGD